MNFLTEFVKKRKKKKEEEQQRKRKEEYQKELEEMERNFHYNRPSCPKCGSKFVAWIIYGYMLFPPTPEGERIENQFKELRLFTGGCCIEGSVNQWRCNKCQNYFGVSSSKVYNAKSDMERKNQPVPDYVPALEGCSCNEKSVKKSKVCGCYSCRKIFSANDISKWIDDLFFEEATALCPFCERDCVLGDGSGYEITEELLKQMNEYWIEKNTWA